MTSLPRYHIVDGVVSPYGTQIGALPVEHREHTAWSDDRRRSGHEHEPARQTATADLRGDLPVPRAARASRDRVEQASVVPDWPTLVGSRSRRSPSRLSVTADGVLFVAVRTHAWMTELSLLEPELLASLNRRGGSAAGAEDPLAAHAVKRAA